MNEAQRMVELVPKIMNSFHDLRGHHSHGEKLSMRQFQALILLNASQSLSLSQLCNKLDLAPSTGTELVNRMIALDYIRKEHEKTDQRQIQLSITRNGLELMKKRKRSLQKTFSHFLSFFSQEEQIQFIGCFDQIWALMKKYKDLTDKQPKS